MMNSDLENLNFRKVYVDGTEITREKLYTDYDEKVLKPQGFYNENMVSPFKIISDNPEIWVEFLQLEPCMAEPSPRGRLLHWGERQFFLLTNPEYEKNGIYI